MDTPRSSVDSIERPDVCPFCRSAAITTTAKDVTVLTYWRCTTCGQIWNAQRLQQARPYRGFSR